jgi:hypothetical protein
VNPSVLRPPPPSRPPTLAPADRATLGAIVTRYPGLASAVHAQVTRLLDAAFLSSDVT